MSMLLFPEKDFEELFTDLHASGFWPDGKEISDAITIDKPEIILKKYRTQRSQPGFDIKKFYDQHFDRAPSREVDYESDITLPVEEHIEKLWPILSREPSDQDFYSSLIPLPHRYIVPGGRFNEIYYWDSYFTMLGLIESGKIDMVEVMVSNFAHMIQQFGFIPNGNRAYYLGRSQPPFFSLMVQLLADEKGEEFLTKFLPEMIKEHEFWMEGKEILNSSNTAHKRVVLLPDGEILNRHFDNINSPRAEMYQDDVELIKSKGNAGKQTLLNIRAACESGWDFSSRWCEVPEDLSTIKTTDLIPVDLNCLLFHLEGIIARTLSLSKDEKQGEHFQALANKRKVAIQKYLWNEQQGTYTDFNHNFDMPTMSIHAGAVYPLAFGIASQNQAIQVAKVLENELLKDGGLATTNFNSGQQWDAPNGWAPIQWMAIWGLRNYNLEKLATTIKNRWVALNIKVFKSTGKLMEKYNVEDTTLLSGGGEYPVQDGFGWTNGVLLKLIKEKTL